ncbi:hypothetical protein BgiBS90_005415, partial [Biomphalaria glabrata]
MAAYRWVPSDRTGVKNPMSRPGGWIKAFLTINGIMAPPAPIPYWTSSKVIR